MNKMTRLALTIAIPAFALIFATALFAGVLGSQGGVTSFTVKINGITSHVNEVTGLPQQSGAHKTMEKNAGHLQSGEITIRVVAPSPDADLLKTWGSNKQAATLEIQSMQGGPVYSFTRAVPEQFSTAPLSGVPNKQIYTLKVRYQEGTQR